jgi:hypothetical protein
MKSSSILYLVKFKLGASFKKNHKTDILINHLLEHNIILNTCIVIFSRLSSLERFVPVPVPSNLTFLSSWYGYHGFPIFVKKIIQRNTIEDETDGCFVGILPVSRNKKPSEFRSVSFHVTKRSIISFRETKIIIFSFRKTKMKKILYFVYCPGNPTGTLCPPNREHRKNEFV